MQLHYSPYLSSLLVYYIAILYKGRIHYTN